MPTGQLTVAEIATRVKRQFGDEAGSQITDADIIRWINDAQREIAQQNNLLQVKANTPTVANQSEYTLPTDVLNIHAIKHNSLKLAEITMAEVDDRLGGAPVGTPEAYWIFANTITLYPTPSDAAYPLAIYYTRQPNLVDDTADTPELPGKYHGRIVEYCLAQAYELDDNMESASVKMGQFTTGVRNANDEWGQRDEYPSITVSPEDW